MQSASHPVHQVVFHASLGPSYVTATPNQIHQTVTEFLNGGSAPGRVGPHNGRKATPGTPVPLTPATPDDLAQAQQSAPGLPFKLYYPVSRVTADGAPVDGFRSYMLDGHPAYVSVVAQGQLGQFYDLEGTTWAHAPILNNPSQTVAIGGKRLQLYYEGKHLRVISWRDGAGFYWLVNTLQDVLTNKQMLAIAAAARPVR